MKCIRPISNGILRYGALHFSPSCLSDQQEISRIVCQDLADSEISIEDLKQNLVILDFRWEGQSDFDIVNLISYLRSILVQRVAVIFNSVVDVSKLDYPAISVASSMVNSEGWFDKLQNFPRPLETDCNFVCLMRRPSLTRATLASKLLNAGLNIRLSFGGMCHPWELTEYQKFFPEQLLPLLIDGPLIRESDNNREHDVTSPLIRNCAVNIIAESGEQLPNNTWKGHFITEKTFKAFALMQFPIWMAVPGLVAQIRNLGFDLFDDIIDHSYDNIGDFDQRSNAVVQQAMRLGKVDLVLLRSTLEHRLAANYQRVEALARDQHNEFKKILDRLCHE